MCKHVHAHIICHISVDTCFLDGSRLRGLRRDPPMPCRWSPVDSSHGHYTNHQVSHHTQDDMHYITIVVIYLQHPVVQNFCLCLEKQKFQLLWWKNAVTKKKRRWETPRKEWSAKNAVWSAKNAVWLAKNAVAIVRLHRNLSRRQKNAWEQK